MKENVGYSFKKLPNNFKKISEEYEENISLWRALIFVSILLNFFTITFFLAFLQSLTRIYYLVLALDMIYSLDYLLTIIYFYWNIKTIALYLQPTKKNWLLITEFFLVFPYSYIYESFPARYYNFYVYLSFRLIAVLRIFDIIVYLRRKWRLAGVNYIECFLIEFTMSFIILIHSATCIWTVSGSSHNNNNLTSLIIASYYTAITSVTNRNLGNATPENNTQTLLLIFYMLSGFILTGYFIAMISFLWSTFYKLKILLKLQLAKFLIVLKTNFCEDTDLRKFYTILWHRKRRVSHSRFFHELPFSLKNEISLDTTIPFLRNSLIFRNKPLDFLRRLSNLIKNESYETGEIIYHKEVIKNKMVFLVSGFLEILSDDDNESPLVVLEAGSCVGESALVFSLSAKSTIRAASYVELQVLYRKDFFTLISFFPNIYYDICERIVERIETAQLENKTVIESPNPFTSQTTPQLAKDDAIQSAENARSNLAIYRQTKSPKNYNLLFISEDFPWILNPDGSFYKSWEVFIVLVALYVSFAYPYYIIFAEELPAWFEFFFNFIDLLLLIDIFVILTTGIKDGNNVLTSFLEITQRRVLQLGFYLDFGSSIKLELFNWIWSREGRLLRLNRLLKAYRIMKYFHKNENNIDLKYWLYQMKYLLYCILVTTWFGSLLFLVTCTGATCSEDGWYFTKLVKDWREDSSESYTSYEYLTSFYFALCSLTGLTPGDITATNTQEIITLSLILVFGIFLFGYFIAETAALLACRTKIRLKFQQTLQFTLRYMKRKKMINNVRERTRTYLALQWSYDEASILQKHVEFDPNKIIFIEEKIQILKSVSLFKDLNLDFLKALAANFQTLLLPPDEIVTYKGEVLKTLYIIEKGYCFRKFEKSYVVLNPRAFFGTMCLFSSVNSLCTVKTLTHVKLICITDEIFWRIASLYPTITTQFSVATDEFDILKEFDKIPSVQTLAHVENFEEEYFKLVDVSVISLISYCRQQNEDYSEPFRKLGILRCLQLLMLPICILPYGDLLHVWITIRTAVALLTAVLTPFQIIKNPYSPTLDWIIFATNLVAYLDLYLMMFVGYYNERNQLILHPVKTAGHYLKGSFIFDLILTFPWDILVIYFIEKSDEANFDNVVRIVKVGQIYRLFQLFHYFAQKHKSEFYSCFFRFSKYLCLVLIYLHFWATLLIANSCRYIEIREKLEMSCNQDSWIAKSEFKNFTEPYQIYIVAVYFASEIVTLAGFGDLSAKSLSTLVIVILMIICGLFLNGYIYAKLAQYFANQYLSVYKYHEMMITLRNFMKNENVQQDLQKTIIERFEYQWQINRDVNPSYVISKLYPVLKQDITYTTYEELLKNITLFESFNQIFLRAFGRILKNKRFVRRESIFKADDVVSELCIIETGVVRALNKAGNYESFLETGAIFGNVSTNRRHKVSVSFTALSNVELLVMDSGEFFEILKQYPDIKEVIEKNFQPNVDFIVSPVKSSNDVAIDAKTYPPPVEDTPSKFSFRILRDFRSNVLGFFLIFLPWKWFRIAVPLYSALFTYFDIVCLILTYLNCIFASYQFSFQHHTLFMLIFAIYYDLNLIMKTLLEMHKSYENLYGEMVTSNLRIFKKYFDGKLMLRILELIINFPFYYIVFLVDVFTKIDCYFYFSCLRLLTLLRIFYFFEYYKRKTLKLTTSLQFLKICSMLVWGTLIIHIFACGWYLLACPLDFCFENSWIFKNTNFTESHDKLDAYLICLYFVTNVVTKTASGDIVAHRIGELLYVTLLNVITIFLIGFFISEIWNYLNIRFLTSVKYNFKIKVLKQHAQNIGISRYQLKKMWRYVRQLWFINRGNQIPEAISLLHSSTFQDLMFETYGFHLKASYVFSDVEEALARQVCHYLKPVVFFSGNFIIRHGDFDNTMYFIHYGRVEILTVHANLSETVHEILRTGEMFGVIQGLHYNIAHHFSFRAKTIVQVVALRFNDWEYLLDFFPDSKNSIYTKTNKVNV